MSERPEIGDIVDYGDGTSVVVGREQGGRTRLLPIGPGGSTREFFLDDLELIEKDASVYDIHELGRQSRNVDTEIANAVATLAMEGYIKKSALPVLFQVVGEDIAVKVADRMES